MKILWAAMVYQNDAKYLRPYIESILGGILVPSEVLIVDAGADEGIREVVTSFGNENLRYYSLGNTQTNRGFNPSFNFSVKYAIENGYTSLATMTARAIADKSWLSQSVEALEANHLIGMVTTLHVAKSGDRIHGAGHFLGPSGGLYDYGRDLSIDMRDDLINVLRRHDFEAIWAPCSGGALYSVEALRVTTQAISTAYDVFHPAGFKSYNCSHIGYLMKAGGFKNVVAQDATCTRDDSDSTSRNPTSCGLLFNQEINRIASLYTYWPEDLAQDAMTRYMSENRKSISLSALDKRIILTLAENLRRNWPYRGSVRTLLEKHLEYFGASMEVVRKGDIRIGS
jgi:hypothetical protein